MLPSNTAPPSPPEPDHDEPGGPNLKDQTILDATSPHAEAQHKTGDLEEGIAERPSTQSKASVPPSSPTFLDISRSALQQDMPARWPHLDEETRQRWKTLREAAATMKRNHGKLDPERQDALLLRNAVEYEQETAVYKRRYFEDSRKAFVDLVAACLSHNTSHSDASKSFPGQTRDLESELQKRHELLAADQQALQQQDNKVREIQSELSRIEFSMQSRERRFAEAAQVLVTLIDELGLVKDEDLDLTLDSRMTRQPSLPSRPASPQFHPLAKRYYDLAGTVKYLRERLVEIDSEHREALILRDLHRDQERILDISDVDFAADHERARAKAEEEYTKAREDAASAKRQCIDAGLDPDDHLSTLGDIVRDSLRDDIDQGSALPPPPYASTSVLLRSFPEEGPITPPAQSPPALNSLYLGEEYKSSALLTLATGPMNEGLLPVSPFPDAEEAHKHQQVRAWIESNESAGPPPEDPLPQDGHYPAEGADHDDVLMMAEPTLKHNPDADVSDGHQTSVPP